MTAAKAKKPSKLELAAMLADALNLLNQVRCMTDEGSFGIKEENDLSDILYRLPEEVRDSWFNNGTLRGRELA